jgi:dipeptidyl aminopeptidase/acylaminoacyl peptidase
VRCGALALATLLGTARAHAADCGGLTPPSNVPSATHAIRLDNLVGLRDIAPGDGAISISPDGRAVAFQMRRAIGSANRYCLGIYAVGLGPGHPLTQVDAGGDYMLDATPVGDKPAVPIGPQTAVVPRWSPDGRWIAFLRRDGGSIQVWRSRSDGSGSQQVTHGLAGVRDFAWSADGRSLIVETHPAIEHIEGDIEREGLSGWHLDGRAEMGIGARPLVLDTTPPTIEVVDPVDGTMRTADPAERDWSRRQIALSSASGVFRTSETGGRNAWAVVDPLRTGAGRLWIRRGDGRTIACELASCQGWIMGVWWAAGDRAVTYLRREGWARASTGVYRWRPGHAPRRTLVTDDLLTGCTPTDRKLICMEEMSGRPRHLVLLDPARGTRSELFDPNPEWAAIGLGKIERLHWRNGYGVESFGDLILPPGFPGGKPLPLIVVQYISRGFLRGGTGDEFPIQLFAREGFAVLSVENPERIGAVGGATSLAQSVRKDWQGFANRFNILSTIESGVRLLIARGVADHGRIGLTGLSDGAVTLQFALLHSKMFSAFASASCCMDRAALAFTWDSMADLYREAGWPRISDPAPNFAKDIFLIPSACRIDTPLLIQSSDAEIGSQLEVIASLRELDKPVDTYVFPDEYHVKWQPAHRAASYLRYIQWFDFWLQGRKDEDPIDPTQYQRWEAWRSRFNGGAGLQTSPCGSTSDRSTPPRPPIPAGEDRHLP